LRTACCPAVRARAIHYELSAMSYDLGWYVGLVVWIPGGGWE
jgi:hypothetical protein